MAKVQEYLNNSYNYFGKKFLNLDKRVFRYQTRGNCKDRFIYHKEKVYGLELLMTLVENGNDKIHVKGLIWFVVICGGYERVIVKCVRRYSGKCSKRKDR